METTNSVLECPFCGQMPSVFPYRYGVGEPRPDEDLVICKTRGCPTNRMYVIRKSWNTRSALPSIVADSTHSEKQGFSCLKITCAAKDSKRLVKILAKAKCDADGWTDGAVCAYNIYEREQ